MSPTHTPLNVPLLLLLVCFAGCKSTRPEKAELDDVPRVDTGILRLIPITGEIELRQPAKIPHIKVASGKLQLAVTNDPGLRTLGHVADGSITYLMSRQQAQKMAAKHGEDCYLFSHGHNLNFISKSAPREWIQSAIKDQLTQSGVNVETDLGGAANRGIIVAVRNLVLKIGAKGMGITTSATVSFDVSLMTNGVQVGRREITGQVIDMRAGMAGTTGDYAKAFQAALEDALTHCARFIEQTWAVQ